MSVESRIDTLVRKAWTLLEGNRHEEAVAHFDKAIELDPEDPTIPLEKGVALFKLERYADALAAFDRALELEPDDLVALNNRGRMLHLLGRTDEALASYRSSLSHHPDHLKTRLKLVRLLDEIGAHDDALEEIAPALASDGNDPNMPDVHHCHAVVLWHLGRRGEADEAMDEALRHRPTFFEALRDRGQIRRELGDLEGALEAVTIAAKAHPEDLEICLSLGELLFEADQPLPARSVAEKALSLDQRASRAWRTKGLAQQKLGERASGHLCLGMACMLEGAHEHAIEELDRAIEQQPDYAEAWSNKGVVYNRMQRYEDAVACYDRALELDRGAVAIWHNKGTILYHKLGRREDGLRCFKMTVKLQPSRWFELPKDIRSEMDALD